MFNYINCIIELVLLIEYSNIMLYNVNYNVK